MGSAERNGELLWLLRPRAPTTPPSTVHRGWSFHNLRLWGPVPPSPLRCPGPPRTYLDVEVGVGVEEVEDALVVEELGIPLLRLVVAEIVSQGHQQHLAAVQLGLLAVLVQQELGSAVGGARA